MSPLSASIQSITEGIAELKVHLPLLLQLVAFAWCVHGLNMASRYRLSVIGGIYPRHLFGTQGIIFSPILHANIAHILVNSLFFLILAGMVIVHGKTIFTISSISIILISGTITWCIGRQAIHIGASGLIMGYWGYLIVLAYYQPDILTIISVIIGGYHFGSSFMEGLLPTSSTTSWEGHVSGLIAGGVTAYFYADIATWYNVVSNYI